MNIDQTSAADVESMKNTLRNVQRRQEIEDTTTAFAFEDDAGHLVKVYVKKDQAEDFKNELGSLLDEAENDDLEISEVIYNLHQKFDIVNVEWCEGAIPEDEEQVADPNKVANNNDAEAQGFPESDPEAQVDAASQTNPDDVSAEMDAGGEDLGADIGAVDSNEEVGKIEILNKVLSLLQAKTDAERAKAEAEKAKADVEASRVAAQAAAQYASSQEEIMDMENYNKREQEDKREATLQAKLIRYRHDLRKESSKSLEDKLNDPNYLLNMLSKAVAGRKLGESVMNIAPPTPEEEELLHAEDWENEQREKKKAEKAREKLLRFRHAQKKDAGSQAATESSDGFKSVEDIKNARFLDFIKGAGFQLAQDSQVANS